MSEIFDIIAAVNRLKDRIDYLAARIESLLKYPHLINTDRYISEDSLSRMLKLSRPSLLQLRKSGALTYIRYHRKILYPLEDVQKYLKSITYNHHSPLADP